MTAFSWLKGADGAWYSPLSWNGANWSGAVPGNSDDVTIAAAGTYTVTIGPPPGWVIPTLNSMTLNAANATLSLGGATLNVKSGKLRLSAGTLALDGGGRIQNATLVAGQGVLLAQSGGLDRVTANGALTIAAPASGFYYLSVQNGLTLRGSDGASAGTLTMTAGSGRVTFLGSQTLDNATVNLGSDGTSGTALGIGHDPAAMTLPAQLTLGRTLTVRHAGRMGWLDTGNVISSTPVDGIVNQGTISATLSGGTLAVTGTGLFRNENLITVGNGDTLKVQSYFVNTGTVTVDAASTLDLAGTVTASQLGTITVAKGGTVRISGTLANTGRTFTFGAGGPFAAVTLTGAVQGGTVRSPGGGLVLKSGTLDGVAFQGTLDLGAAGASAIVRNGLTLTDLTGKSAGTVALTGAGSALSFCNTQAFDNATVRIGAALDAFGAGGATLAVTTDNPFGTATLTLGRSLVLQQAGIYAAIGATYAATGVTPGAAGPNGIVNLGSITAGVTGGTFAIDSSAAFTNQGAIAVSNGDTLRIGGGSGAGTFTNAAAGTISVGAGSAVDFAGTVRTAQLGRITVAAGGTARVSGTLDNSGATLNVGTGTALNRLQITGTLKGGTVRDAGGGLALGGQLAPGVAATGTLDGVTFQGTLDLSASGASVLVRNGLTLTDLSGKAAGAVALTGAGSALTFRGTQGLDNATIRIGAASGLATLGAADDGTGAPATLTLGRGVTIRQTGSSAAIGGSGGQNRIVSQATITAGVSGGTLSLGTGGDFVNQGAIAVSNGDTLQIGAGFANAGSLGVTGATLALAGTVRLSQLGALTLSAATLKVAGTLDNADATLTVGAGQKVSKLQVNGTIRGGTLSDAGGGLGWGQGATLDGIAYQGTLDLSRPLAALNVANGLTLRDASGQPGVANLTGAGARLSFTTTQTLDNATINLGSAGLSYYGQAIPAATLRVSAATLTLGAGAAVTQTGKYAAIDGDLSDGQEAVINAGTINAALAGGAMTLGTAGFLNSGGITVANGETLTIADRVFTNTGSLSIGAGSSVGLSLYKYFAQAEAGDNSFVNAGQVRMGGGTLTELTGDGLFPAVPLANTAAGQMTGAGTIDAALGNDGLIAAQGGTLRLAQAVSGAGTLRIDANATLDLGGAVGGGETVRFNGAGATLRLGAATAFAGSIAGLASGDMIDLTGLGARSASVSGTTLHVALRSGGGLDLRLASALNATLTVADDKAGGSLITVATVATSAMSFATPAGKTLTSAKAGSVLTGTAGADTFQGLAANLNAATLRSFGAGDRIDVTDLAATKASLAYKAGAGQGVLTVSDGSHKAAITLTGSFVPSGFHAASDGHGGTLISYT